MDPGDHLETFKRLIVSLPALTSLTFDGDFYITWDFLAACLTHPRIQSLAFEIQTRFSNARPPSSTNDTLVSLQSFSCKRKFWREVSHLMPRNRHSKPGNLNEVVSREATALSPLVLGMHETVRQLTLSMESAPIASMTDLSWPELRDLSIEGRYLTQSQAESLPSLLSALPQLSSLSILICRHRDLGRAPILGRQPSPATCLSGLRALTVAFPDPQDDIFSIDTIDLRHLSLRDCPRYYHRLNKRAPYCQYWDTPILSSSECLSILQRIDAPRLTTLELVYLVETNDGDDDLLEYVASSYPNLSHLEVHRYRANRADKVDCVSTVQRLTCSQMLTIPEFRPVSLIC